MARQARKDNEREELEKKEGKKEYEEKKRRLKGGYMRVVIGLPIMGVLSWELWERCTLMTALCLVGWTGC